MALASASLLLAISDAGEHRPPRSRTWRVATDDHVTGQLFVLPEVILMDDYVEFGASPSAVQTRPNAAIDIASAGCRPAYGPTLS
jgi:hypothetical protein